MTKATAEIANLFRVTPSAGANFGSEVYPGYPGLVVAEGQTRSMTWGLPLVLRGKQVQPLKPKPVNNARTYKLGTASWRDSFEKRRCLIPVSAWAEAEGPKGAMTRTWLSLPGQEVFAAARIWRPTQEWGEAYAMVMTECSEQAAQVHNRMPVLLSSGHWDDWLSGTPASAAALCQPWTGVVEIERTWSCPTGWCSWGRSPRFPASGWAGHVPGTAESMMMGLSLSGAMVQTARISRIQKTGTLDANAAPFDAWFGEFS